MAHPHLGRPPLLGKLVQEVGAVVLGQEPEERAPRAVQRRRVPAPPVLHQAAGRMDGADADEIRRVRLRDRQHRVVPDAVGTLAHREHEGRLVRERDVHRPRREHVTEPCHVGEGAVLDGVRRVLEQPAERKLHRLGRRRGRRRDDGRRRRLRGGSGGGVVHGNDRLFVRSGVRHHWRGHGRSFRAFQPVRTLYGGEEQQSSTRARNLKKNRLFR